uniref:EABR domain-containing protein n=2 Tax=Loa loa TaxID=7209 RepID=A0A1I7W5F4_LOALO
MNTYVQQLKEEYEKRLRVSERTLHGEKERRRQLAFHYKQLEAQLRKVQRDNESMAKQLKMVRKCASCSHLDQRCKSYNALNELLYGSIAALEPDAIASVSAPNRNDELKAVKIANNNLQQCVDKLQSMLLQKGREALATEKYYNDAISEREQQISRLQKELQERRRGASTYSVVNQDIAVKLKVLLKERAELLDRINRLEKGNKENYNAVHNEPQRWVHSGPDRIVFMFSPVSKTMKKFINNGLLHHVSFCSTGHPATTPAVFEVDVNPYCGCCRNRVKSWNRMLNGKQMDFTGFTNTDRSDSNGLKQKITDAEEIQKLSLALEMEKERNKAMESALKNENSDLSNNYQKLLQQYKFLETELGKERIAEQNAKNRTSQNGQTAYEVDACLISQLKDELDKADKKIGYLEKELTLTKRAIYGNEQFNIKGQIEALEKDKKELTRVIDSQTERLTRFEDQLRVVNREKEALQRKYTELERANNLAVREKLEQLEIVERQRKELSRLEEKHLEKSKAHDAQIEAYQQLIKQKDDERGALIAELCATNRLGTPLHDSINETESRYAATDENRELLKEVRDLNHEKQAMLDKVTCLESELQSMKDQLRLKTDEIEQEVLLKNSMHDDLAKARTMLLEKEARILDLNNELKVTEVKVMKLETELANSADRLQVEQITGSTLKMTIEELEDLLQEKSAELISAAQERQRHTAEIQKMKELKYDLETKLTLQGRKLKEAREKLAVLKKKIQELELEAVNSPDKSLQEATTQQGSSKSTMLAATVTKSAISNATP